MYPPNTQLTETFNEAKMKPQNNNFSKVSVYKQVLIFDYDKYTHPHTDIQQTPPRQTRSREVSGQNTLELYNAGHAGGP